MSWSKAHLRLVKKLPGQPPSGAMVPWVAPGASPSVMKQAPPAAAVSRQRPARSIGGGVGGGGEGGGAAATGGGSGLGALAQLSFTGGHFEGQDDKGGTLSLSH